MPYLIDGHNLIGQLPDIDLADPDDEVKLILKLRGFAGRVGKKMTVVFDNGIPAGKVNELSTPSVQVRFASPTSSADKVLMSLIRQLRNPEGWILVSSDAEVSALARQCRIQVIPAHEFAQQLTKAVVSKRRKKGDKGDRTSSSKKVNPHLSEAEVEEWLKIFKRKKKKD